MQGTLTTWQRCHVVVVVVLAFYLHIASVTFHGFGTQMSAANLLFTYLLLFMYFYLGGSDAPKKGELVEAAYYILIDVYYCLVPVNEHERDKRDVFMFVYWNQTVININQYIVCCFHKLPFLRGVASP
jgi:hypothetical protein